MSKNILSKAKNQFIYSLSNKKYLDFIISSGAMIFGHSPVFLVKKLRKQLSYGTNFSSNSYSEEKYKKLLNKTFKNYNNFIFSNSGSEANIRAIRIVRAISNKRKIAIFSGSWHGSIDTTLVEEYNNKKISISSGVIKDNNIIILSSNDFKKSKKKIEKFSNDLAGVFFEPVQGSIPNKKNLENVKKLILLCKKKKILTCFDEIITGGRVTDITISNKLKIKPNILVLGKIFGGGFPIGITCVDKYVSKKIDNLKKPIFFGGTFSGNVFTTEAGYLTLNYLLTNKNSLQNHLKKLVNELTKAVNSFLEKNQKNMRLINYESIIRVIFTRKMVFSKKDRDIYDRNLINTKKLIFFLKQKNILITKTGGIFLCKSHTLSDIRRLAKALISFAIKHR
tara:strand:+ start:1638 stop:2819 length:1182 start_codon:yes stop_codon:yes gene_type:complete